MKLIFPIIALLALCLPAKAQQRGPADNGFSYAKMPVIVNSYPQAEPLTDTISKKILATSIRVINVRYFLAKTNSIIFLEPSQLRLADDRTLNEGNRKIIYRPAIASNVVFVNESALQQAGKSTAAIITYTYQ